MCPPIRRGFKPFTETINEKEIALGIRTVILFKKMYNNFIYIDV